MTQTIETRSGLPEEMQTLLRTLPRDGWHRHPHLADSTRNWMRAHQGFRQLAEIVQEDSEAFLNKDLSEDAYAGRLAHFGNLLVRNLQGHHTWEDRKFFPELEAADPRFAEGLEMLESDHLALDDLLDRFTRGANRTVQLATLDPRQMAEEARPVRDHAERLRGFLHRHLTDEEDLVVPILLHHRLRG
ncbi:hemerythrin domain-containing protein [Mameliella alba]|nr:hemerythrin domain-containing protein [Mameliella alba]MBY6169253.1 hemerythrin domain-containing protein [Mameliella alba]MBY6174272.1 hemerythrin domain-containing protein [Mameliella alba]